MTITCPHCGHGRDIAPERIPDGAVRVVCPRCREKFDFKREVATEPIAAPMPVNEPPLPEPVAAVGVSSAETQTAAGEKAGFWLRCAGWGIDMLIISLLQLLAGMALGLAGEPQSPGGDMLLAMLTTLLNSLIVITYYVVYTGYSGQTPGKMLVRIKVVRCDGQPLGYGTAVMREVLGKFVSGIMLGIGYLMVAFDANKQGMHDKIAGTYVVKI